MPKGDVALFRVQAAELEQLLLDHGSMDTFLWDVVEMLREFALGEVKVLSGDSVTCHWCASVLSRWLMVDGLEYCTPDRKDCAKVASLLAAAGQR